MRTALLVLLAVPDLALAGGWLPTVAEVAERAAEPHDVASPDAVAAFSRELDDGLRGRVDSFLVAHHGELIHEAYFRDARADRLHIQNSVTKSLLSLAVGRAIQLGHLSMADLDRPIVELLPELDRTSLVPGAETITLTHALTLCSGIQITDDSKKRFKAEYDKERAQGQGYVQALLQFTAPLEGRVGTFEYKLEDPSIVMQVLDAAVPGDVRTFLEEEVLAPLGIEDYAWPSDESGDPRGAYGAELRSVDMVKLGQLVLNDGKWEGRQLIHPGYLARSQVPPSGRRYAFLWWRQVFEVDGKPIDTLSARGAGGQVILVVEALDLVVVFTGSGPDSERLVAAAVERLVPALEG